MATGYPPFEMPQLTDGFAAQCQEPAATSSATYTLRYEDDMLGIEKRVEFEARSAAYALDIARGEAEGRQALLLENGRPLCRLVKALPGDAPYWIIAQRPAASDSAASPNNPMTERNE